MPIFVPFFFHWYAGVVPPLTGVAVKVTEVPVQIAPDGLAAILMLAVRLEFTDQLATTGVEDVQPDPVAVL